MKVGPTKVKMPYKEKCIDCQYLFSEKLGGTIRFPKEFFVYYCQHPDLPTEVAFIGRNKQWTPAWCPVIGA